MSMFKSQWKLNALYSLLQSLGYQEESDEVFSQRFRTYFQSQQSLDEGASVEPEKLRLKEILSHKVLTVRIDSVMFAKVFGAFTTPDIDQDPPSGQFLSRHSTSLSSSQISFLPGLHNAKEATKEMYEPLCDNSWFRVLVLEPGELTEPIECWLTSVKMEEWTRRYEALSYSWKEAEEHSEHTIICNSNEIQIQGNLYQALYHIRRTDMQRVVWADALCINQADLEERSQQVRVMSSIYKGAASTIIWLGKQEDDTVDAAFNMVCKLVNAWDDTAPAKYWIKDQSTGESTSHKPTEAAGIHRFLAISDLAKILSPLKALFACNWFRRRWVIQEIVYSSRAHVSWGSGRIAWSWVGLAAAILRTQYDGVVREWKADGIYNAYFIFRLSRSGPLGGLRLSFLQLLRLATSFETSEPRDVVFALLGIPTKENKSGQHPFLIPDYAMPMESILMAVAEKLLGGPHPLAMLSNAPGVDSVRETEDTMPSWVATWTLGTLSMMDAWTLHHCHEPSRGLNFKRHPSGDECLSISGIVVSSVIWLGDCMIEPVDEILDSIIALLTCKAFTLPWQEKLQLFAVTLCAGRRPDGQPQSDKWVTTWDFAAAVQAHIDIASLDTTGSVTRMLNKGHANRFFEAASIVCQNRRLFVTTQGHLGLGPPGTRLADVISILGAADMPFLLRRSHDRYKLVGEAYVGDVMNGEAVASMRRGQVHRGPISNEGIVDLAKESLGSDDCSDDEAEMIVASTQKALQLAGGVYQKLRLARIELA